jgi:hypothetical protein
LQVKRLDELIRVFVMVTEVAVADAHLFRNTPHRRLIGAKLVELPEGSLQYAVFGFHVHKSTIPENRKAGTVVLKTLVHLF